MKTLWPLLPLLLTGCGAFADAAHTDGGTPDAGITLKIRPQTITQGQLNQYELTFTRGPSWSPEDCKFTYLSELDRGGNDIEYRTVNYQGGQTLFLILQARSNASVGERAIIATVACDKVGQPQKTHTERGRLHVLERDPLDGGSQ